MLRETIKNYITKLRTLRQREAGEPRDRSAGKTLFLGKDILAEHTAIATFKALASLPRWRILQYLGAERLSIEKIAEALSLPPTVVAAHVKVLEDAELLHTAIESTSQGRKEVCFRTYNDVLVQLPSARGLPTEKFEISMPIGAYTSIKVKPTCGLTSSKGLIGRLDDLLSFYEPERITAELIWFNSGYIEYIFPFRLPKSATLIRIGVSMEICSEAPLSSNDYPSDITLWINGKEVGTWTSNADFGGRRGNLTPNWWYIHDSQFGILKHWSVDEEGASIDGKWRTAVTIHDLGISQHSMITIRLGIKDDAAHIGGVNLFGRSFGDYPQDLLLTLEYIPSVDISDI